MTLSIQEKLVRLKDRAKMFHEARHFFYSRGILEVDCPLLSASASVDAHINLIPVLYNGKEKRFLHSSPEYGMKRLLAEGLGDIFQLSHVFRDGEWGLKHNPEFTMVEWYRVGFSFSKMMEEALEFIHLFLGPLPCQFLSYREAFLHYLDLDPFTAPEEELKRRLLGRKDIRKAQIELEDRDGLLNYLLGLEIEPRFNSQQLTIINRYPSSQAALAKTIEEDGYLVSERFEIYCGHYELANGYHELTQPIEQRQRLEDANQVRQSIGQDALPIDENFLRALEKGLPDCCGVAVGFDRLMMLRHHVLRISSILPMGWDEA